jgi:hypothetical protein
MLQNEFSTTMSDILNIIESIGFSPKDKREIDKARKQAGDINAVIGKCLGDPPHAPRHEFFSWLHLEVDRCEAELVENPTHESAEKFHAAVMRFKQAEQSQERIGAALNAAGQRVSQSLAGIVLAHLDKVQSRIDREGAAKLAEIKASNHALFGTAEEQRSVTAKITGLLADLEAERATAASDPLSWLDRNGLALDGEPVQADEHAA